MSVWGKVKGSMGHVVDWVMPPMPDEALEEELEEEAVKAQPAAEPKARREETQQVVNGASYGFGGAAEPKRKYSWMHEANEQHQGERPQLTVHTTKTAKLKVNIYAPTNFDQVTAIADDIKEGKAAVVNYERIDADEQRRICDFVNGTCYVMDGCARRVTGQIVLYVPSGVDVGEAMSVALG